MKQAAIYAGRAVVAVVLGAVALLLVAIVLGLLVRLAVAVWGGIF